MKETKKRKTKAGSKERLLLALILFTCFASIPNSTSHEAIPHYMRHCAITKWKDRVCSPFKYSTRTGKHWLIEENKDKPSCTPEAVGSAWCGCCLRMVYQGIHRGDFGELPPVVLAMADSQSVCWKMWQRDGGWWTGDDRKHWSWGRTCERR